MLAKRRGVNKDAIRLLEGLEEQEVKGFNRGTHSKLETMQTAENERWVSLGQVNLLERINGMYTLNIHPPSAKLELAG